jgi:hypothetical protein
LHHKTAGALREALAEIDRLRADAPTLSQARAEIEHLQSNADLLRSKVDRGASNWFLKFLKFLVPYNTK